MRVIIIDLPDILLNILGLTKAADTLVGNEFIRGISGGQKKRVTVGVDMLKGSNVFIMVCHTIHYAALLNIRSLSNHVAQDEPTTGLDSVTAVKMLSCIQAMTATGMVSCICGLLQPPREVFDLFDHVMVLDDGEISYFGPREEAVPCMYWFTPCVSVIMIVAVLTLYRF